MSTRITTTAAIAAAAGLALALPANASVIQGVNVGDGGNYNVVTGGLSDGADAFNNDDSDNNSWTNIPSFLDGADYIVTDVNDNSNSDLSLTISIDKPAILYVFHSDDVDDPTWLTMNFTDTGSDLLLSGDGDDSDGRGDEDTDHTYSIYEWDFTGDSGVMDVMTFDNDPNTTNSGKMYGIAAVVPTPGAFALLGVAGLGMTRRRR